MRSSPSDRLLHGSAREPRLFGRDLLIAVLMPLWAAYLVKVFAWRTIFQGNGLLTWLLTPFGIVGPGTDEISNSWLVFSYLWLPYMILPLYAGLERIPSNSLLEASADLGGRRDDRRSAASSCRSSFPALVAGSIFTFSLTLGDYIAPDLVTTRTSSATSSTTTRPWQLPARRGVLASCRSRSWSCYLLLARRLGAFESL